MWAEYDNNLTPTGAIWFEALTPSVGIRSSSSGLGIIWVYFWEQLSLPMSQLVPTEQGYQTRARP